MATSVRVTQVGNSYGIILGKSLVEKLHVKKGDQLYVVETQNGIELTPYDPEFAKQMGLVEEIMREDRDVLKKLAE